MSAQHTSGPGPGPWQVREALTLTDNDYYTVSRIESRKRVHLEYASNGKPMLYDRQRANEAILAKENS